MENFIVSARKYRPATFDTVVGQAHITETLKNAIRNNHLAQSFLFCGPRGVGKTTCARILAKTVNCFHPKDNLDPCDECPSCLSYNQSSSFNIHELDAASNNTVDDIRSLIDTVRIPPQVGKFKIYIIDEVHMLSTAAFNAFLKTLEEPPMYAKFILATTEKHKILPTILSRCQIFDFKRITIEDIAKHLAYVANRENIAFEIDALHIIAQKADGALRDALSIFDQIVSFAGNNITYKSVIDNLNVLDYDYYFQITDYLVRGDVFSAIKLFNEILYKGFDGQHFLGGLGEHFRNLMICYDAATIELMEVGENIRLKYKEQSQNSSLKFLAKALEIFNKADIQYQANRNKRLLVEIALMQMAAINTSTAEISSTPVIKTNENPVVRTAAPIQQPITSLNKPITSPQMAQPPATKVISEDTKPEITTKAVKIDISGGGSILSGLGNTTSSGNSGEEKKNELIAPLNSKSAPFSQSQLIDKWNAYADSIAKESPSFCSTLTTSAPELGENYTIGFVVQNKAQEKEFEEKKTDFINHLREQLGNYQLNIKLRLETIVQETKFYSAKEKYTRLAEKNPLLNKWRTTLGLEFEY